MKQKMIYIIIIVLITCHGMFLSLQSKEIDTVKTLAQGNNNFALNLYSKLSKEKGNIFFSPYSISSALAMTYVGAKGNTQKQMAQVLNFNLNSNDLNKAYNNLSTLLKSQNANGIELNIANALWVQKDFPVLKTYTDIVQKYYNSGLLNVDFKAATESARKQINKWVEDKTKNKIKDLIQPGVLSSITRVVLTNAIYFKGNWAHKFKKEDTKLLPFYYTGGNSVKSNMMYQSGKFRYSEDAALQILELPYEGKKLSMIIFLPKPSKQDELKYVESLLNGKNLNKWISNLKAQEVDVYFPKFKTTSQFGLGNTLQSMGMIDAFTAKADFSGITGKKDLFISAVIHKAFVEVYEEGTEAAAATAVVMDKLSIMPNKKVVFKADQPFIFLIRDNQSGSILFMGRIMDPTK